jgi:hypothetical protein
MLPLHPVQLPCSLLWEPCHCTSSFTKPPTPSGGSHSSIVFDSFCLLHQDFPQLMRHLRPNAPAPHSVPESLECPSQRQYLALVERKENDWIDTALSLFLFLQCWRFTLAFNVDILSLEEAVELSALKISLLFEMKYTLWKNPNYKP